MKILIDLALSAAAIAAAAVSTNMGKPEGVNTAGSAAALQSHQGIVKR